MDELERWAASGAMALTGRPDGPPLAAPGRPATTVAANLRRLGFEIPTLLGERAAYLGLRRRAPWSCGKAFRALPTLDGHLALSLPRPSDIEMVPALVEDEVEDAWEAVARWAAGCTTTEAAARVELLGLAGGAVPVDPPTDRPPVVQTPLGAREVIAGPLVVDLTSLWAGPLCAHLLSARGARVVKVESTTRPDGARRGSADFFDLLHHGHDQTQFDLASERRRLRELVAAADLVLEASRPRALRRLGLDAEEIVAGGTSWLSITAAGRSSESVGFGDDVAVRGGLHLRDGDEVIPVGDAIADPLSGVVAAVAAVEALGSEQAVLIDVSMLHVASHAALGTPIAHDTHQRDGQWWVETDDGAFPVLEPATRPSGWGARR